MKVCKADARHPTSYFYNSILSTSKHVEIYFIGPYKEANSAHIYNSIYLHRFLQYISEERNQTSERCTAQSHQETRRLRGFFCHSLLLVIFYFLCRHFNRLFFLVRDLSWNGFGWVFFRHLTAHFTTVAPCISARFIRSVGVLALLQGTHGFREDVAEPETTVGGTSRYRSTSNKAKIIQGNVC